MTGIMEPDRVDRLMKWLEELVEDPNLRARVRNEVSKFRAGLGGFLEEIGIHPERDAPYATAATSALTAMTASELHESSERLEGLSGQLLKETQDLKGLTNDLLSETRALKLFTGILIAVTVVLGVFTATEILHL